MAARPTLADLQEGRVTPEAFLASRNGYRLEPKPPPAPTDHRCIPGSWGVCRRCGRECV